MGVVGNVHGNGISLTLVYAFVTVSLVLLWGLASLLVGPNAPATETNTRSIPQTSPEISPLQAQENTSTQMKASAEENVSVHIDGDGTTVTVNGETENVPPGQAFERSYTDYSPDGPTQSRVRIEADNSSGSSHVSTRTETHISIGGNEKVDSNND